MLWKRITHAFLLGAGMSVIGVGCSAVNALVSSSAGHGADGTAPQRLVAIGRVFENQGRLNRATAMYRQALKADPGNSVAKERMDFIAGINSGKSFSPTERRSQQAIAMADGIQKRVQTETRSKVDLKSALANDAVTASLQPAVATVTAETVETVAQVSHDLPKVETTTAPPAAFDDDTGWVNVVDTGWELAEMVDGNSLPSVEAMAVLPSMQQVSNKETIQIETVGFDDEDSSTSGKVTVASSEGWKATAQPNIPISAVTLDEIAACMENPVANTDKLIQGVTSGVDEGVKALAATLLTECPLGNSSIESCLRSASLSESELLRLSALDALIQRDKIDNAGVDSLVSLLATANSEIRIQAAASLRNCANTDWSQQCVEGLAAMLTQSESQVVAVAASTLGDFGPQAAQHVTVLQHLSNSDDAQISEAATTAVSRIQTAAQQLQTVPQSANDDMANEYLPIVE